MIPTEFARHVAQSRKHRRKEQDWLGRTLWITALLAIALLWQTYTFNRRIASLQEAVEEVRTGVLMLMTDNRESTE